MFAGKAEGQTTSRTLQINLDVNGVVEDYQYNDNTSKLTGGAGVLGTHVNATPVTGESSGK
jgi:hypothetical protein